MRTLTIALDEEAAARLQRLVETGRYGDETQVITEALAYLEARDTEIEDWLRDEVVPS
jgi:Arc/MetJ-type ribon-helix-helix transcriptional regulator